MIERIQDNSFHIRANRLRIAFMCVALMAWLSLPLSAQSIRTDHQTGMTGSMRGLDVVSKKVVWISGTKGEFSVTRDGGRTWFHDTVPGGSKLDFRDLHGFSGEVALLMAAGPGKSSAIFRTENGGKSWVLTYQNTDDKAFFDGMDFFDNQRGLLIGDPVDEKPYLMETRDGGRNWSRLIPDKIPDLVPGEYAFAASGTSLDACAGGSCYLVTGGADARIFRSADYGKTWEVSPLPFMKGDPAAGAFSVAHGPGRRMAAAGGHYQKMTLAGSNIALSEDNGLTWAVPPGAAAVPFMECIRWIDGTHLVACGPPGVWISNDSGKSWTEAGKDGFHAVDVVPRGKVVWLVAREVQALRLTAF